MPVLNYYSRPFSSQQNLQDTFERVGQTLARPLTVIAGHSYKINNGKMTEFNPHLVEKIIRLLSKLPNQALNCESLL